MVRTGKRRIKASMNASEGYEIKWVSPDALKPNPRNARTHSKKQIRQIADSIVAYGFTVPLLVDESLMTLAGHGRLEAAKLVGLSEVPVIVLEGLSEAKKRALVLGRQQDRRERRLGSGTPCH